MATAQISGGVFERSVVLVLHHDEDGAHGVVLNKPLSADIDAVLPGWGRQVSRPATLFQGGPVQLDSALALVRVQRPGSGVRPLFEDLGVADLDCAPDEIAAHVDRLRIFVGYAGWSAGQLDSELATGSWYAVDAHGSDPFASDPDRVWGDVLARQRGPLRWVSLLPPDPSVN